MVGSLDNDRGRQTTKEGLRSTYSLFGDNLKWGVDRICQKSDRSVKKWHIWHFFTHFEQLGAQFQEMSSFLVVKNDKKDIIYEINDRQTSNRSKEPFTFLFPLNDIGKTFLKQSTPLNHLRNINFLKLLTLLSYSYSLCLFIPIVIADDNYRNRINSLIFLHFLPQLY